MMLLQAIVIPDQRYDAYRRSAEFIQRYVFPGGCLPSPGAIFLKLIIYIISQNFYRYIRFGHIYL